MKSKKNDKLAVSALTVNENVSLEEQIARRAHELWQHRNYEHGSDLADWLHAEREVNQWHRKRLVATMNSNS